MYVEENVKLDGFSVLALRLKRLKKEPTLNDMELMEEALKRLELEENTSKRYADKTL